MGSYGLSLFSMTIVAADATQHFCKSVLGSHVRHPENEEHTVSDHLWKFVQRDLPTIVWELCGKDRVRTHFSRVAFSCFNFESILSSLFSRLIYNFCNRCSRVSAHDSLIYQTVSIRAKLISCTEKAESFRGKCSHNQGRGQGGYVFIFDIFYPWNASAESCLNLESLEIGKGHWCFPSIP